MRLVLDTNVVLAGLLSRRGASHWLLRRVLEGHIVVAASVPLFVEYEAVLARPEHLGRIGWTRRELEVFLRALASVVEPTAIRFLWRPGVADPGDEMVVECTVSSQADMLVTFNVRHVRVAARQFGFRVAVPRDAVRVLQRRGVR